MPAAYSSCEEANTILQLLTGLYSHDTDSLPAEIVGARQHVCFQSQRDFPYFPIPFKETETASALKAVEGLAAAVLADLRDVESRDKGRRVTIDLEKTTAFLFQAYIATVNGLGKLDPEVKKLLKDTDLLQAQSDSYRRMSANLYETKRSGEYYHIHGSLEASTTLRMIGLEPFRPDLKTHEAIVTTIETAVKGFTVVELEAMNASNRQAGVPALKHEDFLKTSHGQVSSKCTPWTVQQLEFSTPPSPLPRTTQPQTEDACRPLAGIKVLELCRIIAGPVIGRILAEYGADVLKITAPNLSDVPFFQVDGNMGKHAAELDLKTAKGKARFEDLLADVDIVVDGYRPGAFDKLGYGPHALSKMAAKRGKGIVYVNESCFGFEGEWAARPGWQQIADCVSGVAWAQGNFMGLSEPIVPPFPISDYGTGCMGAIAALVGLLHRTKRGGSWHGKTSLLQYDLLLFRAGLYSQPVQHELRQLVGEEFANLRHSNSVDQISGTALRSMRKKFPDFFTRKDLCDTWYSAAYGGDITAVNPVVSIDGVQTGFQRGSRPNGSDAPTWDFGQDDDVRKTKE
ncbi:CAIB/BAIF family enzyme [Pseudomassariella vexata]|uniref:CAIB/BAIF family enzyme n=1 Tax=Pseudomassariella vexata TaxID=1141098 RepID=A0A1Y2DUX6_9PEZI|nr:CAIB/BAIF family enzyme [Pseudomassariella vexata]ORY62455.1 CAIB/BAIF family enzyme [Pseudomassariella vexata]